MNNSWRPERTVDAERAAQLVGQSFPQLRGLPVVPLAEGWDNTVHLVDDRWLFRFPRRAVALPGIRRELDVLPRIAPLLPLPVPVPVLIAEDDDPVEPWPFVGFALIPGQELATSGLPEPGLARTAAGAAVGGFLRALHSPGTRESVDVDLPSDPMHRGWPRPRDRTARDYLDRLVAAGVWAGDPSVTSLLDEAARLDEPTGEPVLVHGDLHIRHLLVHEGLVDEGVFGEDVVHEEGDTAGDEHVATGVIDWGDVCLADPAVDLCLAYAAFAGSGRAALLAAYGEVPAERELRARALAVGLSAVLAVYAADDDRPALLTESLAGLRRAVS